MRASFRAHWGMYRGSRKSVSILRGMSILVALLVIILVIILVIALVILWVLSLMRWGSASGGMGTTDRAS